ncbi:hypothetical protein [Solibacillus sp. FSL H8-0538]|uniref:hypothetical protein n=1 Tax=Solibacillus sp. FSL H8-0538 TaxID=2921400 RepID=UPI0030FA1C13
MKEDIKKDKALMQHLEQYKVEVPAFTSKTKKTSWNRFIHYLASPTKDPLEQLSTSSAGYISLKVVPLVAAFVITVIQVLLH